MARQAVNRKKSAKKNVDDKYIISRLQEAIKRGINSEDGEVTDVRQILFSEYMGQPYGNERQGYSEVVTRETMEAIEWALGPLVRVFLGGVRAVEFKATSAEDVQQAKLETEVVNGWFFDGNDDETGFMVLYSFLKDILMYPNAYFKVDPVEQEEQDQQILDGLMKEQVDQFKAEVGSKVNILEEENDEESGVPLYSIEVNTTTVVRRIETSVIAPECCIIDHNHHKLNLDKCKLVVVRTKMTKSDLRQLGYDESLLEDLGPGDDDESWNDEEVVRLFYIDEQPEMGGGNDIGDLDADQEFWVHEAYMNIDLDDDGISERRKIVMAGCKVLEKDYHKSMPVVAGSALPMPHKHVGVSYAEIVSDLQKIMTTLTRQLLDNIAQANIQRLYANEASMLPDNMTMDALLDRRSEVVLFRGAPEANVLPEQRTPIVGEIVQAMEVFKQMPQMRTGVAPNISMDPSVLEKSTMGAFVGALEQASQRLELLARLVAENTLVPLFLKMHDAGREHFDQPIEQEVNGQWTLVDPRKWKKRTRMKCNVGVGFNNKQTMLMLLQQILAIQKEAKVINLSDAKTIYNTLEKLIEQANLGHVRTYFVDPKQPGWKEPEPQPDPAMVQAKANEASLAAQAKREDARLKFEMDKFAEESEAKAAELLNTLFGVEDTRVLNRAKVAEIMAKITHLNRDKNAQEGPAEDSSADEFAAAKGMMGGGSAPAPEPAEDKGEVRHRELMGALSKKRRVVRDDKGDIIGSEPVEDEEAA